jgi:metal-responsive CopG/Arc/MetJ family transcriptional regulator
MPNRRSAPHVTVSAPVPQKLALQLDRLCDLTGENRSTITRNALWAYIPQELQSRLLALRGPDKMVDAAPSEG